MHASGSLTYTGNSKITPTQTETPQNPPAVWITPTEDIRHLSNTQLCYSFSLIRGAHLPSTRPSHFLISKIKNNSQPPTPATDRRTGVWASLPSLLVTRTHLQSRQGLPVTRREGLHLWRTHYSCQIPGDESAFRRMEIWQTGSQQARM